MKKKSLYGKGGLCKKKMKEEAVQMGEKETFKY